jgi:hypothetical protein
MVGKFDVLRLASLEISDCSGQLTSLDVTLTVLDNSG